jgi:predicted permease
LPVTHYGSSTGFPGIDGRAAFNPGTEPLANLVFVNPGFFEALGLRLVQGRLFNADDRADHPEVVIINETMARALIPGENPIGRRIGDPDPADPTWYEIVGIVTNVSAPAELTPPDTLFQTYLPLAQQSFSFAELAVRGRVPADQLTSELRRIVAAIDPDQPIYNPITARADIARTLSNVTVISRLLGGFALLGLALAALGIYGVLASFVVQRTQEIGVRIALGAQLRDILQLILGHGLRLAFFGTALGLLGAFAIARLLGSLMPALGSPEPLTFIAVVVGLLAVAAFACWLPARHATRVDPMEALRSD